MGWAIFTGSGAATWKVKFWPGAIPMGTVTAISCPPTFTTICSPPDTVAVTDISIMMPNNEMRSERATDDRNETFQLRLLEGLVTTSRATCFQGFSVGFSNMKSSRFTFLTFLFRCLLRLQRGRPRPRAARPSPRYASSGSNPRYKPEPPLILRAHPTVDSLRSIASRSSLLHSKNPSLRLMNSS